MSLTKTIDAKKAKTGDEVVAKVTQDLKTNAGDVIVAKDTKVVGHVTEAQPRNKEQKESQVGITFDHAVMKDGSEMQMPMSIQAIVGPQNSGSQNSANSAGGNSEAVSEQRSRRLSQFAREPAGWADPRHRLRLRPRRKEHAERYTDGKRARDPGLRRRQKAWSESPI